MTAPEDGRLAAAYARHRGTLQHMLDAYAQVDQVTTALRQVLPELFDGLRPADAGAAAVQLRGVEDLVRAAVLGSLTTLRVPPRPVPPRPRPAEDRGLLPFRIPLLGGPPPAPPPPPPAGPVLVVHVPTLLDQLQAVFEAADRLLAAAAPPPPREVVRAWADDKDLVDLFHDLLTADLADDGELALRHCAQLRHDLKLRYGIRRVLYDGSNEEYFAFSAGEGGTTIRPALVTEEGRILRRGEVRGTGPVPVSGAPVQASVVSEEPTAVSAGAAAGPEEAVGVAEAAAVSAEAADVSAEAAGVSAEAADVSAEAAGVSAEAAAREEERRDG